jgi:hypothetical protein
VILNVTNWLGTSTTIFGMITRTTFSSPSLQILTGVSTSYVSFFASMTFQNLSCVSQTASSFEWHIDYQSVKNFSSANSSSVLVLNRTDLQVGRSYYVTVIALLTTGQQLSASTLFSLDPQQILCSFVGGYQQTVSSKQDLILDASASIDPDSFPLVSFEFGVVAGCNLLCDQVNRFLMNQTNSRAVVPSYFLPGLSDLEFMVTVTAVDPMTNVTKSNSCHQTIVVADTSVVQVVLKLSGARTWSKGTDYLGYGFPPNATVYSFLSGD